MTDIELAKQNLDGHTLVLCKDGNLLCSKKRGIAPMIDFLAEGRRFIGYSAADIVVGKAAAILFVKAGVTEVFAKTLSESGKAMLEKYGIRYSYGVLTDKIINREKTDVCPMEKAVMRYTNIENAYRLLNKKVAEMKYCATLKK